MSTRTVVLIPARFESSRYPGKPLVSLCGKPMIIWVSELSARAVGADDVYFATEYERISEVVEKKGFKAVMTGPALTGTDRLAEAASKIDADLFINVQGDEPLVNPSDILKIRDVKLSHPEYVINGFSYLSESENPNNVNIPKVITTESDNLVYMSRSALPGFKVAEFAPKQYKKQVCIYAFSKRELASFRDFGRKSQLEFSEDIEILRFLELGMPIKMVETLPGSLAVDCPDDIDAVEKALIKVHSL